MLFLITAFAQLLDPITMVGYIAAGVFLRRLWAALLAAAGWAIAAEAFVTYSQAQWHSGYAFGDFLPHRFFGAVLVTAITFWIATIIRKRRAATRGQAS